ncbi:MAG TPA: type II secretion system F family protein [Gaiellaceae bacterium]|nr:type II secretion system F family protein [Gaiellaceae bacterium]
MTGFLLGLVFATGVALLWAGVVCGLELGAGAGPLGRVARRRELPLSPPLFLLAVLAASVLSATLVWSLVHVPALAVAAAIGGGYAPIGWAGRWREQRVRERERAWPAALSQLADALEAGIAFPAAVALVAESGPVALRADLARFHARLRAGGLAAAIDGLQEQGERTADTVALLLRAGLLELPAGGLAPVLRELASVLSDRLEAREKARSRASTLELEAAILALSPILLFLLVGLASPDYLDAYRTPAGTLVGAVGGVLIFGCYLLMLRLGRVPEPRRTGTGR